MRRIVVKYKALGVLFLVAVVLTTVILQFDSEDTSDLIKLSWRSPHSSRSHAPEQAYSVPGRPWFMSNGSSRPVKGQPRGPVWPEEGVDDRITNQLMFVPPDTSHVKSVWVDDRVRWGVMLGGSAFSGCPVDNCVISEDRQTADARIYRDVINDVRGTMTPTSQIWIMYLLENPFYSGKVKQLDSVNWTATYRSDSDIVAPYEKWVYYDEAVQRLPATKNYATNKTKKAAWFVSNCGSKNQRLLYAKELQKYIDVDIYGLCGTLRCARSGLGKKDECLEMVRSTYKFYLSFENANCRDYITEKMYLNALRYDVIPIVMGAYPDDYQKQAPFHSYIHVDDFPSAQDLATYLQQLDSNDELYNSYFEWKGTGEFINTHFMCRLCAMLHDQREPKHYPDFDEWWKGPDICRRDSWTV